AMLRAGAVGLDRMAGKAAVVDFLAMAQRRLVQRRPRLPGHADRGEQQAEHADGGRRPGVAGAHDTKAMGTGFSPSAWRRTAQCIASSPRMLAATFASSRSSNSGTAPR